MGEKRNLSRKKWKSEVWYAPQLYIENAAWWIEVFVKDLLRIYRRQNKYLDGSRIYWESIKRAESKEFWLDGLNKLSRFYQEETQKSWWIKKLLRSYLSDREQRNFLRWIKDLSKVLLRLKKESLIEMNLSRIYWEAVELKGRRFFKKGKNT